MKTIVLIEDNKDVRENTAEILELEHYKVTTAENGQIGVETVIQIIPDLIICDIMMPVLDGYEVFERLSKHPSTSSIPFIFLSAKSEKTDFRKGMNLGADDYLTKPFEEKELIEAVDCRIRKNDFLKREFSKNLEGITNFLKEASQYLNIEELSTHRELKSYTNKDHIFSEGSSARQLYFIDSGHIKTYRITESGKEFVTGFFGPGDFIGQFSLLNSKGVYLENAIVIDAAEVYMIPKTDFTTLLYQNRDIAKKFIEMISHNLAETQDQLVDMAFSTVRKKTAKALLDLHHKGIIHDDPDKGVGIPREDFAGLIGSATETAIRMLSEFRQEGLIGMSSKSKLIILDKTKLKHIAEFEN
jgi:CheY-like chemotaxis protein/CRP-like cAMP-binding protein